MTLQTVRRALWVIVALQIVQVIVTVTYLASKP